MYRPTISHTRVAYMYMFIHLYIHTQAAYIGLPV